MTVSHSSTWFVRPRPLHAPRLRLFCLPHAGGGPAFFHPWVAALPHGVELCALVLPGRGTRFHEPAYTRLPALLHDLQVAIRPFLDAPFAFFGHSLGALLAFELSRSLIRQGHTPLRLFASGCPAPHLLPAEPPLHDLPPDQFVAALCRLGGIPPALVAEQELLDLMLPILRADLALYETYVYAPAPPLTCTITALGGSDDACVSPHQLEAWRAHTAGEFHLHLFSGDHFYLQDARDRLLSLISEDLHATERHV